MDHTRGFCLERRARVFDLGGQRRNARALRSAGGAVEGGSRQLRLQSSERDVGDGKRANRDERRGRVVQVEAGQRALGAIHAAEQELLPYHEQPRVERVYAISVLLERSK